MNWNAGITPEDTTDYQFSSSYIEMHQNTHSSQVHIETLSMIGHI